MCVLSLHFKCDKIEKQKQYFLEIILIHKIIWARFILYLNESGFFIIDKEVDYIIILYINEINNKTL